MSKYKLTEFIPLSLHSAEHLVFSLIPDPAREIEYVDISDGKKIISRSVIPHFAEDENFSLGIFDQGNLLAILYSEKLELGYELQVAGRLSEEQNNKAKHEFAVNLCNVLQTKEYSLKLLKSEEDELVYISGSDWEKNLHNNSLCKNNEGKVCAYKDFFTDIKNRPEWHRLNIYDELKNYISFRDDVHAQKTIISFTNSGLENESFVKFYLEFPLMDKTDGIVLESKDKIPFLLSKGEKNSVKINSLCKGDKNQLQDLYFGFERSAEDHSMCKLTSAKITGDEVMLTGEAEYGYLAREPRRNPELDKFALNFADFIRKSYFTRDIDYICQTLPEIISSYKDLPENKKLFDILKDTGFITVKDRSQRTWQEFWNDLLYTISQFLRSKTSPGELIGKGTINFVYSLQIDKFDKMMRGEEVEYEIAR